MSTHNALATLSKGHFDLISVPTPASSLLKSDQVLIKIEYASMIAFDTYINDLAFFANTFPIVFGFNGAGTVVAVGEGVKEDLKTGDRVTAFTFEGNAAKSMQEYSLVSRATVAKIPSNLSLSAAATLPDNFITAFNTLFSSSYLNLPVPSSFLSPGNTNDTAQPPLADAPILIYGAGSTTGQYALQLLRAAGYTHVIATASEKHHAFLRELGARWTFDYRSESLTDDIVRAAGGKIDIVVDCITAEGTLAQIGKVVSPLGTVALLLPIKRGDNVRARGGVEVGKGEEWEADMLMSIPEDNEWLPRGTKVVGVRTFLYLENEFLRTNLMPHILPNLLEAGLVRPNAVHLLDEEAGKTLKERVGEGLELLRNNRVSGEKVVVKVQPIL